MVGIKKVYLLLFSNLQHLRKISKYIAQQNERIYNPRGIHLTDPILRGLRVLEVTIIDLPNCQSPTGNSTQLRHT